MTARLVDLKTGEEKKGKKREKNAIYREEQTVLS